MTNGERLRELLAGETIIMAPGAYDAWSAKLVAKAGFPAVYMTGYGVSASTLGVPDIGLISFKEMLDAAQNIVRSAGVVALCDADTGFGGRLNVMRTVEAYENAGVAAIQLEDQAMPKRCGHMEGKQLISTEEMVAKLKIARATRQDPSLCIIARTDATAVDGFAAALERAKAYEAAGADIIFMRLSPLRTRCAKPAPPSAGPCWPTWSSTERPPCWNRPSCSRSAISWPSIPPARCLPPQRRCRISSASCAGPRR